MSIDHTPRCVILGRRGADAPAPTFAHPVRIAVIAVVGLSASWAVALQDPVPEPELRMTTWFNDAPDWVATMLYPIMQLGTVAVPLVAGLIIMICRRDVVLGAATIIVGATAWIAAKVVKSLVERGRPHQYLPGINVRDGAGTGLGYVSGHSAVAAATAVMVVAALPRGWRPLAVVLAVLVGIARIVHGVHLPADVVGGWALGTLLALVGVEVVDRIRARSARRVEERGTP